MNHLTLVTTPSAPRGAGPRPERAAWRPRLLPGTTACPAGDAPTGEPTVEPADTAEAAADLAERAAAAAGACTLPNGRVVAIAARGVYWAACRSLGAFQCYPVDARGDCHAVGRSVRADASPEEFDRCEAEVRALLDQLDPPPCPRLVR